MAATGATPAPGADAPRVRILEERLLEVKGRLAAATAQNEKLSYTLRESREHIAALREEVDKLTRPPSPYAVVAGINSDGTLDVHSMGRKMRLGDRVRIDPRASVVLEVLPRPEVDELLLEEVPDVGYDDIGGLSVQIEAIADAVELPFLHQELFAEHRLPAPKGILLYGPPGCGKTLIAKAVANSLARKVAAQMGEGKGRSYFINIKGPELLNKYVGETERQ
ncbi:MAG: AAA family ATPase, partial [Ilumatobacter sp.]